jgi:hypothetical protein
LPHPEEFVASSRLFLFAFSRTGQVLDASLPEAEAARERVLRAIEAMERGERALATDPAACRFCGYRRVGMCPGRSLGWK